MTAVGEAFLKGIGKPNALVPSGLQMSSASNRYFWNDMQQEIGSGWFMDGFLYLFGEGLDELKACLDAWSFAVPRNPDRKILGRNAYGAILFLDNESKAGNHDQVGVIDPTTVEYWHDDNCVFVNLIGNYLPRNQLTRNFLDDGLYRKWRAKNRGTMELHDVLALTTPTSLGGKMELSNVQLEEIVEYYKSTASIYSDATSKAKAKAPKKKSGASSPKRSR